MTRILTGHGTLLTRLWSGTNAITTEKELDVAPGKQKAPDRYVFSFFP